jgi:hypothetical protein
MLKSYAISANNCAHGLQEFLLLILQKGANALNMQRRRIAGNLARWLQSFDGPPQASPVIGSKCNLQGDCRYDP